MFYFKGGFPLTRFWLLKLTHVHFNHVSKIEARHVNFKHVRSQKLRDSGNQLFKMRWFVQTRAFWCVSKLSIFLWWTRDIHLIVWKWKTYMRWRQQRIIIPHEVNVASIAPRLYGTSLTSKQSNKGILDFYRPKTVFRKIQQNKLDQY